MRRRITTSGNSAALVLSQDLLGLMGVGVGDEVDVSLVDKTLVVRSLPEAERSAKVQNAIDEVFRRDAGLLRRLGEGVTGDESAGSSGSDAPEIAKRTVKKTAKK